MAFAGVSVVVDGKLSNPTLPPVDAGADSGYHLLVVRGYSRTRETALSECDYIFSSSFTVGGHRWYLEFHPCTYEKDEEFISVFLVLDPSGSESVEARFVFSFIDQPELRGNRQSQTFTKFNNAHGVEMFARRDVLERSRHMKNDGFTIRCDVSVVQNTKERGAGTIRSHFGNLLLCNEGADVTFEVDGKSFAAHRCVLAARSAVFKAQFFANIGDEGATAPSVVKIKGIDADVFGGLLTFIYTGAMPDLKYTMEDNKLKKKEGETVWLLQLLEASDQYDLQGLKAICEEILACRYICATSVADIVGVAERRGCLWLKEECLEFIKYHTDLPSVFTSCGLEKIISHCTPTVLKELLSKFAS